MHVQARPTLRRPLLALGLGLSGLSSFAPPSAAAAAAAPRPAATSTWAVVRRGPLAFSATPPARRSSATAVATGSRRGRGRAATTSASSPSETPATTSPDDDGGIPGGAGGGGGEGGDEKTKPERERRRRRRYPPSRSVTDPTTGRVYRLCAAAAVLRSADGFLLVGERVGRPGSWQCAQGGVDGMDDSESDDDDPVRRLRDETVREAAERELYEEMGLKVGVHVEHCYLGTEGEDEDDDDCGGGEGGVPPVRYETKGTGSWLEDAGFAGQELRWVLFRCIDDRCERDPGSVCDLSGLDGERAEFTNVRWESVEAVVEGVWEKKKGPYVALAEFLREKGLV